MIWNMIKAIPGLFIEVFFYMRDLLKTLVAVIRFFRNEVRDYRKSLRAYKRLYRAGFRISWSEDNLADIEIYRFWWGNKAIGRMPDIDCVQGKHWSTVANGFSMRIDKDVEGVDLSVIHESEDYRKSL